MTIPLQSLTYLLTCSTLSTASLVEAWLIISTESQHSKMFDTNTFPYSTSYELLLCLPPTAATDYISHKYIQLSASTRQLELRNKVNIASQYSCDTAVHNFE